MSIALTGLLTGFAKGAKERIEKEREENEALIESRLKLANTNKLKREKERDAQKALLNQRYDLVSGYLPADATEEQKLALISNETVAKEFAAMRTKGEEVDLNKFLVINKDKIPQGFTSVRQYIDTIAAAPTALSQEQMQQAFGETRGFLGARTGVSAGRAEKLAQQYGAPAAELLAYEQPQQLPQMPEVARMNVEMLKEVEKEPKSQEEMLKRARAQQTRAKLAGDNESYEQFKSLGDAIESDMTKPLKSMEDRAQRLLNAMVDAQTPEEKAKIQSELSVVQSAIKGHKMATSTEQPEGSKPKTVAAIDSSIRRYVGTRMREDTGASWYKYTEEKSMDLPDGTKFTFRGVKVDMPPDEQRKMFAAERQYMRQGLLENNYINKNGVPAYDAVREVMNNLGLSGSMPTAPQQTRTKAQIEAVAASKNIPYAEAKAAAEKQGIRVIE